MLRRPTNYKGEKGNGCTPDLPGMDETDLAPEFKDACDIHDWQYGEENTKRGDEHQKEADDLMLANMLEIASTNSWFKKTLLTIKAYVFYGFVRSFGRFFYRK